MLSRTLIVCWVALIVGPVLIPTGAHQGSAESPLYFTKMKSPARSERERGASRTGECEGMRG
jgi:hypothetical protein